MTNIAVISVFKTLPKTISASLECILGFQYCIRFLDRIIRLDLYSWVSVWIGWAVVAWIIQICLIIAHHNIILLVHMRLLAAVLIIAAKVIFISTRITQCLKSAFIHRFGCIQLFALVSQTIISLISIVYACLRNIQRPHILLLHAQFSCLVNLYSLVANNFV